jgi:segregation and condensation protein B
MELKQKIESLLFVSSKPLSYKTLAKLTGATEGEVRKAGAELVEDRKEGGVVVLEANGNYQMATNAENSDLVKSFLNQDLREKLTEATVEVLAIIAYRQPISKAEVEAIRGVNSQYSLRALLMRGMIEKIPNPYDARGSLYQVTTEFLQHMGLNSVSDLPDFDAITGSIKLPDAPALKDSMPEAEQQVDPEQETTDE